MTTNINGLSAEKSYFEHQRELLVGDVAASMENVLQNMNKLNRSLEGIIAVGNEFGHVESLWSQFESIMAKGSDGHREEQTPATDANANSKR